MLTLVVGAVVVLLFVAGMAALADYLGRRSALGTGWTVALCAGVAAGVLAGGFLLDYSNAYYTRPLGWTILLAAVVAAVVALVVLVARATGRGARRALALGGFVLLAVVLTMGLVGLGQMLELTPYPWEARARQIGEAGGFTPFLVGGQVPESGYEPVGPLSGPRTGLVLNYGGFVVHERKAPAVGDAAALRAVAAVGTDPMGNDGTVTPGVTYETVQINGAPALLAQWVLVTPGGKAMIETATLLVFRAGDTEVRMWSSQVDKPGAGGISPDYGVSPERLIDAAAQLRPLR